MRNTLSDVVYEKVYTDIVSGKLQPGAKITEMGLANSTGTSRSPVREALKRLSEDRLVTLVAHSRCYVRELTTEEVSVLFEIRKRLEGLALEFAFDRIDKRKLLEIKAGMEDITQINHQIDKLKVLRLDRDLHTLIRKSSGSEDLIHLLSNISARADMFRTQEFNENMPFTLDSSPINHIAIINAILSGDREESLRLLGEHIDAGRKILLDFLYKKEAQKAQEAD